MKTVPAQMAALLTRRPTQRNVRLVVRFIVVLVALIVAYSIGFHLLMAREGQSHSLLTGLYWTLTVMSTLGFGDITFHTDLGRVFSILVLMSGMLFLLVLLPFTLIEFFWAPWVEARERERAPRQLPEEMRDHVLLTHHDAVSAALIRRLTQFGYRYTLLVPDTEQALHLHDTGINVMVGYADDPATWQRARLAHAAMVVATDEDVVNTNVAFTAHGVCERVPIVCTARTQAGEDILSLAGSSRVFRLGTLMGRALARRTSGGDAAAHVVGRFDQLLVAEATAQGTPMVGRTLEEVGLRAAAGVTVVGVWQRGEFQRAEPATRIAEHSVLVMVGAADQMRRYDELYGQSGKHEHPVVILGGGRVGRATGAALSQRGLDWRIVEKLAGRARQSGDHAVVGDASDLEVLNEAGIEHAPAVVVTTGNDDVNIYLTIFCRKLRPDVQLISRATLERNVATLHRAGADFVLSYASMGANMIFNCLKRSDVRMVAEGLNIFRVPVPEALVGQSPAESHVRARTGCTVVATWRDEEMQVNPDPSVALVAGEEIVLIGDAESERRFFERYGQPE